MFVLIKQYYFQLLYKFSLYATYDIHVINPITGWLQRLIKPGSKFIKGAYIFQAVHGFQYLEDEGEHLVGVAVQHLSRMEGFKEPEAFGVFGERIINPTGTE